ncbi:hypothetical protein GZH46_00903, partial [Fragariocoptes setiger]
MMSYDDPYYTPLSSTRKSRDKLIKKQQKWNKSTTVTKSPTTHSNRHQSLINKRDDIDSGLESMWTYKYGVAYSTRRLRRVVYARVIADIFLLIHHSYLLMNSVRSNQSHEDVTFLDTIDPFFALSRLRSHLHLMIITGTVAQGFLYAWGFSVRFVNGPKAMSAVSPNECKYTALTNHYVYLMTKYLTTGRTRQRNSNKTMSYIANEMEQIAHLIREHNRTLKHAHNELESLRRSIFNQNISDHINYWPSTLASRQLDCVPMQTITLRVPIMGTSVIVENSFGSYLQAVLMLQSILMYPSIIIIFVHSVYQGIIAIPGTTSVGVCARAIYITLTLFAFFGPMSLSVIAVTISLAISFDLIHTSMIIIEALRAMRHHCEIIRANTHYRLIALDNSTNDNHHANELNYPNTSTTLECIDTLAVNLMMITNALLEKVAKLDQAFGAGAGAFVAWIMSIAMFTIVFAFDHYNDITPSELINCCGLACMYFCSLLMFSTTAIVNHKLQIMEKQWGRLVSHLGYETQQRIRTDLLVFMADHRTYSVKAFGKPITFGFLC